MIDPYSQTWQDVQAYSEARLVELRAKLEGDINPEDTAGVRGRIREVKQILALAHVPEPLTEAEMDIPG